MNNFEEALEKIEALEKENINLKSKLKVALWKIESSSVEETNNPVGTTDYALDKRLQEMEKEKNLAMQRFTERLTNEARKNREARNAKN